MFIVLTGTCYYLATSTLRFIVNNYAPQLAACAPQQVTIERIPGAGSAVKCQGPNGGCVVLHTATGGAETGRLNRVSTTFGSWVYLLIDSRWHPFTRGGRDYLFEQWSPMLSVGPSRSSSHPGASSGTLPHRRLTNCLRYILHSNPLAQPIQSPLPPAFPVLFLFYN